MKTLYIEQIKRTRGIMGTIKPITIKGNKIVLNFKINNKSLKKKEKIAKNIKKILIREKAKQVVIEKEIKKDKEFLNLLYGYNINICSEKWLFKRYTEQIIDEVLENKKEESAICICINELDDLAIKYILTFAKEFKIVNIITKHIGKFKKIEEKLYKENGILITLTNNKRKSLAKAGLILNIDFPKEIINQFTIYDKATIISWEEEIKILKKRFCGKIIDRFELNIDEQDRINEIIKNNNLEEYDIKDVCQALKIVPVGTVALSL